MNQLGEDERELQMWACQFPLEGQALVEIICWEWAERQMMGGLTEEVEEDGDGGQW